MDASQIGVVFDCDGTLLDSAGAWSELEASLAQRAGVTLTKADKDILITLNIPECAAFYHDRFGLGRSAADVTRMIDDFMTSFYRERAVERPGALAFVEGLAKHGVRMTVASSSPRRYLEAGLARCGFAEYFDAILSVEDVRSSKREPHVWHHAREIMGTPLAGTWGVEDSIYAVRTLSRAGYRTLGIYECDASATWDELTGEATQAIRTFEGLQPETFLRWCGE